MAAAQPYSILILTTCLSWVSLSFSSARLQAQSPVAEGSTDDDVGFADGADSVAPSPTQAAPAVRSATEDDVGFGDLPSAPAQATRVATPHSATPTSSAPSPFALSASVRLQSAARLERSGVYRLAKLRQVFAPRLEYKHDFSGSAVSLNAVASGRGEADFAYLLRPNAYDAATLQIYGSRLIPGESWLGLHTASFDLTLGKQIVTFGQGEVLTALDVVNPRDLREPLIADLDQLRLPVLMTRTGLSFQDFRIELLAVHEPYFGLLPPPLGEFSPFRKLLLDNPALAAALAGRDLRNRHFPGRNPARIDATQFHARLSWHGSGVDLALQAASLLDASGVARLPSPEALAEKTIAFPVYHPRYGLLGHSGAFSVGAFVLRWELASELKRPLLLRQTDSALPLWSSERLNTLRGLVGLTYAPSTQTSVALELLQSYVFDNPGRRKGSTTQTLFPVEATQIALRANHQFLRERAYVTLVAILIGVVDFNAWAGRLEFGYALLDAVKLSLGWVTYQPSQHFGVFYGFERNDRVFCNLRWDFSAN